MGFVPETEENYLPDAKPKARRLVRQVTAWGIVLGMVAVGLLAAWYSGPKNAPNSDSSPMAGATADTSPAIEQVPPEDEPLRWLEGAVPRGSSLYLCLVRQGIPPAEVVELQKALKPLFNLRKCPAGSRYELALNHQDKIAQFTFQPNGIDLYALHLSPQGSLEARKEKVLTRTVKIEGEISSSLYESLVQLGHSPEVAMQLADIFAWQIDFLTEPRPGDQFKLLVEEEYRDEASRLKAILAAQYSGKLSGEHTAVFFRDPSGHSDYYTPEGKSLRKAFLRAPLKYRRISSGFSKSRLHPILRIRRPHLAIDYAAPTGTPVSAIGDAVVLKKGWSRQGGNYLKLRHLNGYVSTYCHLSRFEKRINEGTKVRQGQVIAYVGSTGLATGPHLDFSISKDGERINFLTMKLPSASAVNPNYLSQFSQMREEYLAMLNSPTDADYVVLQARDASSIAE